MLPCSRAGSFSFLLAVSSYYYEALGALIAFIGRGAGSLAKLLKSIALSNNGFLMINPLTGPIVEDLAAQGNKSITIKEKKIVVNENELLSNEPFKMNTVIYV